MAVRTPRQDEFIVQANGLMSQTDGVASHDVDPGDVVYANAVTTEAAEATVLGDVVIADVGVAALDTHFLYVSDGTDVEAVSFTAAGINTKAELKTRLEALLTVTATITAGNLVSIIGKDGNNVIIDADDASVFAGLGLDEGVTEPTVDTVAGFADYKLGLTADEKKTAAIARHAAKAGEPLAVLSRHLVYNRNLVSFPAGTEADAVAALEAKAVTAL